MNIRTHSVDVFVHEENLGQTTENFETRLGGRMLSIGNVNIFFDEDGVSLRKFAQFVTDAADKVQKVGNYTPLPLPEVEFVDSPVMSTQEIEEELGIFPW